MGQIYSSAESVFVWLGLYVDGSKLYFDSLSTRDGPQLGPALQTSTVQASRRPKTGLRISIAARTGPGRGSSKKSY